MRIHRFLPILLPFLLLLSITACDDNSNSGSNNNNNQTPGAGVWKVTYFFDKQDETGNYGSYTFEFDANGEMRAKNGSNTYNGTWSTGVDDSANKFIISFDGTVPSALSDLEEDWRIIEMTDSFMHFEHTSGGNGDTDILKFTKN